MSRKRIYGFRNRQDEFWSRKKANRHLKIAAIRSGFDICSKSTSEYQNRRSLEMQIPFSKRQYDFKFEFDVQN